MKYSSSKARKKEPEKSETERIQYIFVFAAMSAGQANLDYSWATSLRVCGIIAVPLVLLASAVYAIWSRFPLKPQSEKMREERLRRLGSGFWGILREIWCWYLLGVSVLPLLRLLFEVQNLFLPAFWRYVALNLGQALFYGVVASTFAWLATRRLVAAPLVSTA